MWCWGQPKSDLQARQSKLGRWFNIAHGVRIDHDILDPYKISKDY